MVRTSCTTPFHAERVLSACIPCTFSAELLRVPDAVKIVIFVVRFRLYSIIKYMRSPKELIEETNPVHSRDHARKTCGVYLT